MLDWTATLRGVDGGSCYLRDRNLVCWLVSKSMVFASNMISSRRCEQPPVYGQLQQCWQVFKCGGC